MQIVWLLRVPKRWKTLGLLLPSSGLVTGYGGCLRTTLPTVLISRPVNLTPFDALRNIWLASDWQKTPTSSKPSPPGQIVDPHFFYAGMQAIMKLWKKCLYIYIFVNTDYVEVRMHSLLLICHVYTEVRKKFLELQ